MFSSKQRPSIPRHSPLPNHSSSAVNEKFQRQHPNLIPISLPIPGIRTRRLRVFIPNVRQIHRSSMARFGRKRGTLIFWFTLFLLFFLCFAAFSIARPYVTSEKRSLIFKREDIQRIWDWEVRAGHYPSREPISSQVRLLQAIENPSLPPQPPIRPAENRRDSYITSTHGRGPQRKYFSPRSRPPNVAYPPRPVPGSVADLDVIMEHCNFSEHKYVRDCLEVLRVGAGLDTVSGRLRRTKLNDWRYIYLEQPLNSTTPAPTSPPAQIDRVPPPSSGPDEDLKRPGVEWEIPPLALPSVPPYNPFYSLPDSDPCDPESPKIFHMFWAGRFTEKPYLALLSFLYTQPHGIHRGASAEASTKKICRPQFWLWINPGPAASVPNANAHKEMFDGLKESPWAVPFLHPRFKDVIKFKLWNTTEQLDGVEELRDEWRNRNLFTSDGWALPVPKKGPAAAAAAKADAEKEPTNAEAEEAAQKKKNDDLLNRVGSDSKDSYDRVSVVLSDLARFVLCHRYGGIYLDADTLFLRDWEELWNWKGAFTYRWSRLPLYNTAVLKMNKGSALGKFLFKTALKNNFNFHPWAVARYMKDAKLEPLLLMLPDALFDSAWLNTEDYQMDRPPQPFLTDFADFFETPTVSSGSPQALGFDGFFKGAFSYHWHNFWWNPFDPARNWPDLGPRFAVSEGKARKEHREAKRKAQLAGGAGSTTQPLSAASNGRGGYVHPAGRAGEEEEDARDLSWAAVLKRTFESYLRGEVPSMYGEWLDWGDQ